MHILCVCTGNICRSPFAEHLIRRLVNDAGWLDVDVASAGTYALVGRGCPEEALVAARKFQVELSSHVAVQAEPAALLAADLLLAMSPEHVRRIRETEPTVSESRIRVLSDFAPGPSRPHCVPDPYGHELWAFEASYRFIDVCARGVLDDLGRRRFQRIR